MNETIDLLQESREYYFVDYIPFDIKNPKYLELEEFFVNSYLDDFAEKIVRISLKLIYFYPCEVYLTEPAGDMSGEFDIPFDTNIRNFSPEQISYAIKQIITRDFSSVQILFTEPSFLISIDGEFAVTVYCPPNSAVDLLNQLVGQEGLYLKKGENEQ